MRNILRFYLFLPVLMTILTACGSDSEKKPSSEDHNSATPDTSWIVREVHSYFNLSLPPEMMKMELNDEASLEFGMVEEGERETTEFYALVLMETREELDSMKLDFEFDAVSYRDLSIEALGTSLANYKIIRKDEEPVMINGIPAVINETRGEMLTESGRVIPVYYMLTVYQGKKAFYQLLTWCKEVDKKDFRAKMERIAFSFQELTQ